MAVRIAVEVSPRFDDAVFVPLSELLEPELLASGMTNRELAKILRQDGLLARTR